MSTYHTGISTPSDIRCLSFVKPYGKKKNKWIDVSAQKKSIKTKQRFQHNSISYRTGTHKGKSAWERVPAGTSCLHNFSLTSLDIETPHGQMQIQSILGSRNNAATAHFQSIMAEVYISTHPVGCWLGLINCQLTQFSLFVSFCSTRPLSLNLLILLRTLCKVCSVALLFSCKVRVWRPISATCLSGVTKTHHQNGFEMRRTWCDWSFCFNSRGSMETLQ